MKETKKSTIYLLFAALAVNLVEAALFLWLTRDYRAEGLGVMYMRIFAYVGATVIFLLVYLPILGKEPRNAWLWCFGIMLPLNTLYLSLLGS